ncbi:hypothetical protein VTI74DRAFT_1815 [Chaetomium olivicolor]
MAAFLTLLGTGETERGVRGGLVASGDEVCILVQGVGRGVVLLRVGVGRGGCYGGCGGGGLLGGKRASEMPMGQRRGIEAIRALWIAVSVVGLSLMSQSDVGRRETPSWVYLTYLIPERWFDEHRFWRSAGVMLFMLVAERSSGWRWLFSLEWVKYLERISCAIYLMHGPVLSWCRLPYRSRTCSGGR